MTAPDHRCSEPIRPPAPGLSPTTLLKRSASVAGTTSVAARPRLSLITRSTPSPIKWEPAPASFPPGARMAVLQGDASASELFVAFLRLPDGYEIPPHTYAADAHFTVITGTLKVGAGTRRDDASMVTLCSGGAASALAGRPHYASARGLTIVQVNGRGPFTITYVGS